MRAYKVTPGPYYDTDATMVISEHAYLLEIAFTSYFLRKVSCVIGKQFLALCTLFQKDLVHSMAEHFQTPVNKLNNLNFNTILKKHGGPHKMS